MDPAKVIGAALLLPLFPLSLVFNRLVAWAPGYLGRAAAILVLPQAGILMVDSIPRRHAGLLHSGAFITLIIFTALFYAFKALSVREMTVWARLMATSGLSLDWILVASGTSRHSVQVLALAWSVPAALLMVWAGLLARRTGGAYLGLQDGYASVLPRLSGLVTLTALALVATPVFPSFFGLLHVFDLVSLSWLSPLLLLLFIWAWSLGRFLQDLLFGTYRGEKLADLSVLGASVGFVLLLLLALSGLIWSDLWIGI